MDDRRADIAALYRQTWPRLIGVLVSIGGSRLDAELVAQDAYARLLGRWDAIRRFEDPEAWVRGVAVRTMVGRLRRREVVPRLVGRLFGGPVQVDASAGDVAAALAGMTPEQRAVVVLHDVMELPVEQIAQDLELPVGGVNARLARARRALGRVLEDA
ncbi:sigma factor-like helix-turn-helix DNA-binding protein [Kribbella sp. NPDC000426]|uniref:sigma factor-like helix-turn-helix DNA-binding protein n=1 Tax=Kribbella sp. NPDC000426 TaxID=3154255 RepID=UPI003316E41E